MQPQEIADAYDKLAGYWAGSEFDRANGIPQHERAIRLLDAPGDAIDIGCGSSGRIIDLLLKHEFNVEGLDISPAMLALARQRHPAIDFHLADICEWEPSKRYDLISAWDSIWHVPLASHEPVLRKLCDALNPGGVIILSAGDADEPGEVTNPCLGQPLYHATLGLPALLRLCDTVGVTCRHLEYDQGFEAKHLCLIGQKTR